MSVVGDFPDWSPHVATAQQIAATGVPLLALPQLAFANPAITPAPGSPYVSPSETLDQVSYEIYVTCQFVAGTAVPFVEVQLRWFDPGNIAQIASDTFIIPGATGSPGFAVRGRGPCKGASVIVAVTNLDAVNTPTVGIRLSQHSRIAPVDDWRWWNAFNSGQTVPGWTLPGLPPDESVLAVENVTIGASSSVTRLAGMFAGAVGVGLNVVTGSLSSLTMFLQPQTGALYAANNPVFGGAPPGLAFEVAGVRAPMRLVITNSATTAVSLAYSLIAKRQAN